MLTKYSFPHLIILPENFGLFRRRTAVKSRIQPNVWLSRLEEIKKDLIKFTCLIRKSYIFFSPLNNTTRTFLAY